MITIQLDLLQALNIEMLVEARIRETNELAEKHPGLPMKDAWTERSYLDILEKLRTARETAQ